MARPPQRTYVTMILPGGAHVRVWDRTAQVILFVASQQKDLNEHDCWQLVFDGSPGSVRPNLRKHYPQITEASRRIDAAAETQ